MAGRNLVLIGAPWDNDWTAAMVLPPSDIMTIIHHYSGSVITVIITDPLPW